jgi:hypothetical protein
MCLGFTVVRCIVYQFLGGNVCNCRVPPPLLRLALLISVGFPRFNRIAIVVGSRSESELCHRLKGFEDQVLTGLFGRKTEEAAG